MTMYTKGCRLQGKGACSAFSDLQKYPFSHVSANRRSCSFSFFVFLKHCSSRHLSGFHPYLLDLVCLQCVLFISMFCSGLSSSR